MSFVSAEVLQRTAYAFVTWMYFTVTFDQLNVSLLNEIKIILFIYLVI